MVLTNNLIKSLRPTYAVINLERLAGNIEATRRLSGSDIIAIVKANGYGHGAKEIARYAYEQCNIHNFGVATLSEGCSLRSAFNNDDPRIIVLGYVDRAFYADVIDNNLMLTIYDKDVADSYHEYLHSSNKIAHIGLKLDTGMNRLGFNYNIDLDEFRKKYPYFRVKHVMSHLSSSDDDAEYTEHQQALFDSFIEKYGDGTFDTSLFNSSAIVNYRNTYNLTRPGILLYGYCAGMDSVDGIRPVMSIYSKIVHVHKLQKGDSVSYNRKFVAQSDCIVGVVPIGYADGYSRYLSNNGRMFVNGVSCPVLGSVCMDMTIIDITPLGEDMFGADVEVIGDNVTITEIARLTNTIEYVVMCGISDRIPRIYIPED